MDHVCVGGILVDTTGGRLLLARRAPTRTFYPDVWDMPGGHCEPGETPDRTLGRELEEELGVTPTKWRLLEVFCLAVGGGDETMRLHIYVVTEWIGAPSNRSPEEHAEIAWLTLEDACRLSLADSAYPDLFRAAMVRARGH